MDQPRKFVLVVALAALALVGVLYGWQWYRSHTYRGFDEYGGTVLVYEIDEVRDPDTFKPGDLVRALQRGLDPADVLPITIRARGSREVVIAVPRQGPHHPDLLAQTKDYLAQFGRGERLEFRLLANDEDDNDAIEAGKAYFVLARNDPSEREKLEARATAHQAPPGPVPPDGKTFHTRLGNVTYSWVELGLDPRHRLNLDNAAESDPTRDHFWLEVKEARARGEAVAFDRGLVWSRVAQDPPKKYEYFVLTREPEPDEEGRAGAVAGGWLLSAKEARDQRGQPAVEVRCSTRGAERLAELTTKHKGRQMAILVDDQVAALVTIHEPVADGKWLITGEYTREELDHIANVLRAGAPPATLKPQPVSETAVAPAK